MDYGFGIWGFGDASINHPDAQQGLDRRLRCDVTYATYENSFPECGAKVRKAEGHSARSRRPLDRA